MCVGQQRDCSAWPWRRDSASHSASHPRSRRRLATPDGCGGQRELPAPDELPNPAEDKRRALRSEAITQILNGEAHAADRSTAARSSSSRARRTPPRPPARPGQKAAKDAKTKDQYVELKREKTDKIFVILAEFGNERHPSYPDQDTSPATPGPVRFDGPLHNEIHEPNRAVDNSTVWQADYSADHYRQLYFGKGNGVESLKTYYEAQSSGRYSVDGEVTDWVKVQLQRGPLRPQQRLPLQRQRLLEHLVPHPGRDRHVGGRQEGRRRDRRADQDRAGLVRPVGPQRLRRRRQLQRAGRLHRPLPDRPRRWRPGRR